MLRIGTLVDYEGSRWIVARLSSQTRLATLIGSGKPPVEVPDTLDIDSPAALAFVAHPATEWPVVSPQKRLAGPITEIILPEMGRVRPREFRIYVDWVTSDPLSGTGSVFFSPDLKLSSGDVLVATHKNGSKSRITIPHSFGTVLERKSAQGPLEAPKPIEPSTRFNRPFRMGGS